MTKCFEGKFLKLFTVSIPLLFNLFNLLLRSRLSRFGIAKIPTFSRFPNIIRSNFNQIPQLADCVKEKFLKGFLPGRGEL